MISRGAATRTLVRVVRRPAEWPFGLDLVLVATAGALHAMAFGVNGLWWLQGLGAGVLAWRAGAGTAARSAWLGGVFGTAWLGASVWWLYISMHTYGGLPGWMSAAAVALLAAGLSVFLAAAMAVYAGNRTGSPWRDALLFAGVWLLAELARGQWFTGFPWAASGYAHVDSPLEALAPWVGVYGVGAASAGLAALVAQSFSARAEAPSWFALSAAALLILTLGTWGGGYHTRPGPTLQVTLLQPNVPQDQKFAAAQVPQTLAWVSRALTRADGDLIVAPETAVPLLPDQLPEGYWERLAEHFARPTAHAALVGVPLGSYEAGYTNSVAGLSERAARLPGGYYRYDKHHLVPFGEFIPTGFRWFTNLMDIPLGDFSRSPLASPSFEVDTPRGLVRVAPNICYEDLFGEELAARFRDPAQAPDILANVSNIAWFGPTVAVPQHLQIARMRALEFQRPVIRATNTGATAVIDHTGRVTDSLPPFTRGQLQGVVQGRTGLTPFVAWASQWGLWPLWAGGLVLVLAGRRWRAPAP